MAGRIFLANVGANASHPFTSPIFDDGTFEVLPIPEASPLANGPGASLVRYGMLRSFNRPEEDLRAYLPSRWWDWPCHADPEFYTCTYGDDCDTAPRAAALKGMGAGDTIFFIARLVGHHGGKSAGAPGFYLIGYLEVAQVLASVRQPPTPQEMAVFGNNAHIRRALAAPQRWDSFWVFKGSANSRRFRRAAPVTQSLAQAVFRNAQGGPWRWDGHRSVLQTIGSYTRSCRCIIDPAQPEGAERAALLWSAVAEADGPEGLLWGI